MSRQCLRFADDAPGQRGECERRIAAGDRCYHCPDHPLSPEQTVKKLKAALAAIHKETRQKRYSLLAIRQLAEDALKIELK